MSQPEETLAAKAYQRLRYLILRTELKPGQMLAERDLMSLLEVGRTPLREAVQSLAHEGLIDIVPRRGTFVSQLTLDDLQQIFEVRLGIESMVAQAAVSRATASDLAELKALVDRAKERDSSESDVELDHAFHELLLKAGANSFLAEIHRRIADASLRLLYLTDCGMESPREQYETFRSALVALENRDASSLAELLRQHVRAFMNRVNGSIFSGVDLEKSSAPASRIAAVSRLGEKSR